MGLSSLVSIGGLGRQRRHSRWTINDAVVFRMGSLTWRGLPAAQVAKDNNASFVDLVSAA
jgi:hypothetical protein